MVDTKKPIDIKAKCIRVEGNDAGEFQDLVGTVGRLVLMDDNNWFGGGSGVRFSRRRVVHNGNDLKVITHAGNAFVFEPLNIPKLPYIEI